MTLILVFPRSLLGVEVWHSPQGILDHRESLFTIGKVMIHFQGHRLIYTIDSLILLHLNIFVLTTLLYLDRFSTHVVLVYIDHLYISLTYR